MKRAFTLMEVLVVIAIVLIVAAITFPVVVRAKDAAFKAKSVSNMHQVSMAIELYAQENNGSPTGTLEAMGLPPWPTEEFLGNAVKELYPPKRTSPNWNAYGYNPIPSYQDRRDYDWQHYTEEFGGSAVVIWDPFFNPPASGDYEYFWQDPYVTKFMMGMTLSGSLVRKTKAGLVDLDWWKD